MRGMTLDCPRAGRSGGEIFNLGSHLNISADCPDLPGLSIIVLVALQDLENDLMKYDRVT